MRMICAIVSLAVCLAASACQTTPSEPNVTDAQRAYWTEFVQRRCIIATSRGGYVLSEQRFRDDLIIHNVVNGVGGWIRVDFVAHGFGGDLYYSRNTRAYHCGKDSWRETGITFVPLSGSSKAAESRRWQTYNPAMAGPYVTCRSAAGTESQMAESLCKSFGGTVVGRSSGDPAASAAAGSGGDDPPKVMRPAYLPLRPVTLIKCRFPDGTVIGEDLTRCTKVGGEIVGDIETTE